MNIYQKAAATKLRFKTNNGAISAEDLFDLPLSSKNEMNLDTVAKTVYAALKAEEEGSFVNKTSNPRKEQLELAMEIVKDVIRIKQEVASSIRQVILAKSNSNLQWRSSRTLSVSSKR